MWRSFFHWVIYLWAQPYLPQLVTFMDVLTIWLLYLLFLALLSSAVMEDKLYFTSKFKLVRYLMAHRPLNCLLICVYLKDDLCSWKLHLMHLITMKVVGNCNLSVFLLLLSWYLTYPHIYNSTGSRVFWLRVMTASCRGKHYDLTSESQWQPKPYPVIFTDCFSSVNFSSWRPTPANTSPFLIPLDTSYFFTQCDK